MRSFADRADAGRQLARRLAAGMARTTAEPGDPAPVVLGLPRGGVPVAAEVARALDAPLDVLIVRKVGVPWHEEVAMGAVGEDGAVVRNAAVIAASGLSEDAVAAAEDRRRAEVMQRAELFRRGRPPLPLEGRTVIIVDDGIATGATARAACRIARARGAEHLIVATPVAPADLVADLPEADEVVSLLAPEDFIAVGMHYIDFRQTADDEVIRLLSASD